jgi:hypothetical protein
MECEHGQLARSCNICEYEREIDLLKGELELAKQEVFTKDQVIAELKAELSRWKAVSPDRCNLEYIFSLEKQLSHLTSALNDYERAERVAVTVKPGNSTYNKERSHQRLPRRAVGCYHCQDADNGRKAFFLYMLLRRRLKERRRYDPLVVLAQFVATDCRPDIVILPGGVLSGGRTAGGLKGETK